MIHPVQTRPAERQISIARAPVPRLSHGPCPKNTFSSSSANFSTNSARSRDSSPTPSAISTPSSLPVRISSFPAVRPRPIPAHKQIIPYSIFHHRGRYLVYTRGGKSGEKRLASKQSIGIGGHINPHDEREDSLARTTYLNGVEREIDEELRIAGTHTQRVIGLINDDSNEVGRVHLGVVHLFDLESHAVESNEDAIQDIRLPHAAGTASHSNRSRPGRASAWSISRPADHRKILPVLPGAGSFTH